VEIQAYYDGGLRLRWDKSMVMNALCCNKLILYVLSTAVCVQQENRILLVLQVVDATAN